MDPWSVVWLLLLVPVVAFISWSLIDQERDIRAARKVAAIKAMTQASRDFALAARRMQLAFLSAGQSAERAGREIQRFSEALKGLER